MGIEKIVITGAEVAEVAMPGVAERMLAEIAQASPMFGRLLSKGATEAAGQLGKGAAEVSHEVAKGVVGATRAEANAISRTPRPLTLEEEEAQLERLVRALDDRTVGLPPKELVNKGLGARVWEFGSAGGDVLRERTAAEATGQWSPALARSREWLRQNPESLTRVLPLPEKAALAEVQMVHQGISTQFAVGPVGVALRTDNVATCAAIHCTDGTRQFLGHADGMVHHRAVTEALNAAGIDLNNAHVTLMPGPLRSPVLETILPAFIDNPNAMSRLRIIPFRGPAHGSVIAKDGELFIPKAIPQVIP